jgi:hypothetical protein
MKYKNCIYTEEFVCTYGKGEDYKANGEIFKKFELADGSFIENRDTDKDINPDISIFTKTVDKDYNEDEITTIYIHTSDVLPLKIYYEYRCIYSAKGFDTQGNVDGFITEVFLNKNGNVETKDYPKPFKF